MQEEKRIYRMTEVIGMYGVSKPTLYRMMNQGRFPRPIKLSKRAVGWTATSLEDFDRSLILGEA